MVDLVPVNSYDNVRRLEATDSNAAAVLNVPNQALLNRTTSLKANIDSLNTQLGNLASQINGLNTQLQGLTIGEEVQAYSQVLTEIAGVAKVASRYLGTNAANAIAYIDPLSVIAAIEVVQVEERYASGSSAGDPTAAGSWFKRSLNTLSTNENNRGSLSGGQLTLAAGKWRCYGYTTCCGGDGFSCRLYNITDAATLLIGSSGNNIKGGGSLGDSINELSFLRGTFTITASKILELQIQVQQLHGSGVTLGLAASRGQQELFSLLYLERMGAS